MEWWQIGLLAALLLVIGLALAAFILWRQASGKTKELAERLGKLPWRSRLRLAARLMRDRRIPAGVRVIPPLLVLYLAMPLDLVPDFIPLLGQLDDVAIILIALGLVVRFVPLHVIDCHIAELEKQRVY